MANRVVWFDIPVIDLGRAMEFYSKALLVGIIEETEGIAVMEHDEGEVAGCLMVKGDEKPSNAGILLYFNVNDRLDEALETVEELGGRILKPKEQIGKHGYRAIVLDSEGNRIALHSD